MKPFIRFLLLLTFMLPIQGTHASETGMIDIAGQQRMLSQRMVKSWCQIGLNVQPSISKSQLDEAVRHFENNLNTLDASTTTPETRTALSGLRAAWTPLRASLGSIVRQSDAAQLDARAEDVLMAAERLVRVLQNQASAPTSRWVNLASRQRMLSQRLVKIYMLQQWGVNSSALRDERERVENEFAGALTNMQQNPANNLLVRTELDNLALQWEWLHTTLATEGAESFRLIMAEAGDAVLELADNVTRLYQQSPP